MTNLILILFFSSNVGFMCGIHQHGWKLIYLLSLALCAKYHHQYSTCIFWNIHLCKWIKILSFTLIKFAQLNMFFTNLQIGKLAALHQYNSLVVMLHRIVLGIWTALNSSFVYAVCVTYRVCIYITFGTFVKLQLATT